jgi:hypothetical protein
MNSNEQEKKSNGALNGANGKRPTLLAKILGFATHQEETNGDVSHTMTSEGVASVNIEKLLHSDNFKRSAEELKRYTKTGPTPTP